VFFADNQYRVNFIRRQLPDGCTYLIPKSSQHRAGCITVLNGMLFEPRTHRLVEMMQSVKPGNIIHAGTFFADMLPSFSRIGV